MSSARQRLVELLVERATVGLDEAAQRELVDLQRGKAGLEDQAYELAAAAAHLALLQGPLEPLPAHLRRRIEQSAAAHFARKGSM